MKAQTVLEALTIRLKEQTKRFNPALESAPVAILWTDERREWEPVLPRIKEALPELFALGAYEPDQRSGPGVWLRMVADGQAGSVDPERTAILYLPGVGNGQLRTDLRGLKGDPQLAPLAELQYRGCFWRQENGKDWTLRAFLESRRGGLGLQVSASQEAAQALKAAMGKLLMQNLPALDAMAIDERTLNDLINPAPDETVLRWLTAPEATRAEHGTSWESFAANAKKRFGVDLAKGPMEVAQRILASKSGEAAHPLWEKYVAHWHSYPDAYEVFRGIAPPDLLLGAERYPRENDADERRLADELLKAASLEPVAAAQAVLAAESRHAARREALWARQGHAPLATALADLALIAKAFLEPVAGGKPAEAARRYAENGWRVDAAARGAMAMAQQAELEKPIHAVLVALYRRWLEKQAEGFQWMVKKDGYPTWNLPAVADGTVVLFVDGLRFDLARELEATLHKDNGLTVGLEPGFTSIPSVTSSGKVWVSPARKLADGGNGGDFAPRLQLGKTEGAYTAAKLRKAMEPEGVAVVDTENPSLAYGRGWAEFPGDIDSDGHAKGRKLARAIPAHLDDLAKAIRRLLNAGWKQVWVVTDHGWLLLPDGLPKAELPARLTETKWGRCAVLKDAAADADWLVLPWSFDPAVRVALAPGISAFSSGREYDHGGLSLQESVVPFLRVQRHGPVAGQPRLVAVSWNIRRTICTVRANDAAGLTVSIERLGSTIGDGEAIDNDGKGRVVLEEVDDLIGEQIAVVLRSDGQKVAEERLNFGEAWEGSANAA
ncbi:MAG: BREX-1 system phosphatase PglZ type B [Candidatus Accumulibacter sp.]|uniref:BREX-1 system phosphatase PglZ type B n=1 Tax=Accumulibacter sp. TaxID=2053492 RepID=UPI0025E8FAE5|nr:BREX-1 system phosphatase PglZ type B [Accumulibacter sp.]MCM8614228.1 BREX-1 system phosphatase PglZ type B [Accumulibacter sp.]